MPKIGAGISASRRRFLRPQSGLDHTFTGGTLPAGATFTRTGAAATYFDANGLIQTVAADTPRFDCAPDLPHTARGILIEAAATNECVQSRDFTNASWTKTNITAAKNVTGMDGVANSASRLTAGAANGTVTQAITSAASTTRWFSVYMKRLTGSGNIDLTLDNGTGWTTVSINSTFWTRVSKTQSLANPTIGIRIATSGDAVAVDFAQEEAARQVSSAIPTTTASVARGADILTMPTAAVDSFSAAVGTWAVEYRTGPDVFWPAFLSVDAGSNNDVYMLYADGNPAVYLIVNAATVGQAQIAQSPNLTANSNNAAAFAYATNDIALSFNGAAVVSDTSATTPAALTTVRFGANVQGDMVYGWIRRVRYWPTRKTNAEVQAAATFAADDTDFTNYNLVTNLNIIPVTAVTKPTYLQTIIDPDFGTQITRITGDQGSTIPVVGGTWPQVAVHRYSTNAVWNADMSLMLIGRGVNLILDGSTYQVLFTCPSSSGGVEGRWHPVLPDVQIIVGEGGVGGSGNVWVGHMNVYTGVTTIKWTSSAYRSIGGLGGSGNGSHDGSMINATATRNSDNLVVAFRVNIDAGTKGPDIGYSANGINTGEGTLSSGGSYIVLNGHITGETGDGDASKTFDAATGSLLQFVPEYGEPSHYDVAYTPAGAEVYVGVSKSTGRLLARNIATGATTFCSATGFYPNDAGRAYYQDHTSTRCINRPGWAYVSEIEVMAWKLDGSFAVNRFCHHRTTWQIPYESEPHACPSPDGKRMVFASDWQGSGSVSTYVCDIRALAVT
jgi:hypothetical protein